MSYFPKPSLNENDLAIIERGATAAHSIDAGQYVSWHGRTGKAKAAILQGATLSDSLFDYDEDGMLNVPLGWREGNSTSSVESWVNLPNDYNELFIVHQLNDSDNTYVFYVPKNVLQFISGEGIWSGTRLGQIKIAFDSTRTKVKVMESTWNGTNIFYKMTVFYR